MNMSRLKQLTLSGSLLSLLAAPSLAQASKSDVVETYSVLAAMIENRCGDAVAELNRKLPNKNPEILILAGTMYEKGQCLNEDWEKGAQLYQQAAQLGARSALPRLVALYALHDHDPAAALWWAAQRPTMLPKACLPTADPLKDAPSFLNELRSWPIPQLSACSYHAGVIFRMLSDTSYGVLFGASDEAKMEVQLNAETATIQWQEIGDKKITLSRITGDLKPDLSTMPNPEDDRFVFRLWSVGVKALQEFGPPPVSAASWSPKYTFAIEHTFDSYSWINYFSISPL